MAPELEDFPRVIILRRQPIPGHRRRRSGQGSNLLIVAPFLRWVDARLGWDPKEFPLLINARAESYRQGVVPPHAPSPRPCSGLRFHEWHRPAKETSEKPQAYCGPRGGGILAFAGLMETWSSADGSEVDTAAS